MSDTNRIHYLFSKYLNDTCTTEELHEFWHTMSELAENGAIDKQLEALWKYYSETQIQYISTDKEKIFANILQKRRQPYHFVSRKTLRFRITAAASIILLVASVTFYLLSRTDQQHGNEIVQETHFNYDVPPGGNRAVLTLSGGEKIVLDTARNGYLAQQGNTKISKLDNGKLEYNVLLGDKDKVVTNTISTPRGGEYSVVLPDGTKVWLNADSKIKFPNIFTGNERKVEISGEVYFEVAHNAKMPFIVKTGEVEVRVLGTHFNINAYKDEGSMKVTLLEGSVQVISAYSSAVTTLKPGQQAQLTEGSELKVSTIDVEEVVAWKNGEFQFNETDISTLMRQIARWYDIEVVFANKAPSLRFGGSISRKSNLSQVLKILEISGVKISIEEKKIIVM